jgi:hypothetical protein
MPVHPRLLLRFADNATPTPHPPPRGASASRALLLQCLLFQRKRAAQPFAAPALAVHSAAPLSVKNRTHYWSQQNLISTPLLARTRCSYNRAVGITPPQLVVLTACACGVLCQCYSFRRRVHMCEALTKHAAIILLLFFVTTSF